MNRPHKFKSTPDGGNIFCEWCGVTQRVGAVKAAQLEACHLAPKQPQVIYTIPKGETDGNTEET